MSAFSKRIWRALRVANVASVPCRLSGSDGKSYSSAAARNACAEDYAALPLVCQIPLSQPLSELPAAMYINRKVSVDVQHASVTTLANGVRVVTEPWIGDCCTVGAVVDAGSRYEARFPQGVSHFLEKIAFTPGTNFCSAQEIAAVLEKHNAIVDCQHTKDSIIYASSCNTASADALLQLIADSILYPAFGDDEIETARQVVRSNVKSVTSKPEPEELLTDLIHASAFRQNTLGLPKYCPDELIDKIDGRVLCSYMKTYFTPDRIIIGGVGVGHDALTEAAQRLFVNAKPIWHNAHTIAPVDRSIAQYTGGEIRVEKDLSAVGQAINPFPELAHLVIGLESCKLSDADDFVPICVLNSLMGGGGSFSAGGPGKGMYTRLYMDVLNRHHWIYNATCVNLSYTDSGLFFIRASTNPDHLANLVLVITNSLLDMNKNLSAQELQRAKTQLKSSLLMNLEQRPVRFEDVTRQMLSRVDLKSPLEYANAIDAVTAADIDRVVDRLLSSSRVSVVGYGTLRNMQRYEDIDLAIGKRDCTSLKSKTLFY